MVKLLRRWVHVKNQFKIDISDNYYNTINVNEYELYYNSKEIFKGKCTVESSQMFKRRNKNISNTYFNTLENGINVSSVGIGSNILDISKESSLNLFNSIIDSVSSGNINIIDTAVHYNYGRSQKNIAAALKYLNKEKGISREEIYINNGIGHIHENIDNGTSIANYISKGILNKEKIYNNICLELDYLKYQIEESFNNLKTDKIDNINLFNIDLLLNSELQKEESYNKIIV